VKKATPKLAVSDTKGGIYIVPHIEAAGMKAGRFFGLEPDELVRLPAGSQILSLPNRAPVGYDPHRGDFASFANYSSVAAFTPPGYTITHNSAYKEIGNPRILPLFAYGAAAFYKGVLHAAAMRTDNDIRHDQRFMDMRKVAGNAVRFRKIFPKNRLIEHLQRCALSYNCPNAQNFFLHRYEGPLPTSPYCNASCHGCISYQPQRAFPPTQPRIEFVPTPEEVKEVALFHIYNTKDPIVSFGQGCEGEPLIAADTVEKAIRLIRKETDRGIININTNASRPHVVKKFFDAGLDSIRVSMNSVRNEYYTRYYKPRGYAFKDVAHSIKIAKERGRFVSINYLTMPGFTDSKEEFSALTVFIEKYLIDMIQWRNLNFDPVRYFDCLKFEAATSELIGVKREILLLKKRFPHLMMGYFNPSLSKMRHLKRSKVVG
jgi:pyruvate-formate lyase-activating enzyme